MVTDDFLMIILTLLGLYLVLYLYLNLKAVGCSLIHLKTILWMFFFFFLFYSSLLVICVNLIR